MYFESFKQMQKTLGQLDKWLEIAGTYAQAKAFDPSVLLGQRLAPDQFPFSRQVQFACDTARSAASRLTGKEAPAHVEGEATLEDLRTRVRNAVAFLDGLTPADFTDAATRSITQPRWEGKVMTGHDYFLEHAQPNFFFHATHAYAILRHNGVPLGKRDYLGALSQRLP